MEKHEILAKIESLKRKYGEWAYDIPLPHDIWTKGNIHLPHTRLKRIVQVAADLVGKPLSACKVLDLGCLDGQFSVEFAQQGAQTMGVEIREANVQKALLSKEALNLKNLEFRQGDARDISVATHGIFDVIVCSGLLYHLTASEVISLIRRMNEMTTRLAIIDTHIAFEPHTRIVEDGQEYFGFFYREHEEAEASEVKAGKLWASWNNDKSFWFTRPSLVNVMTKAGFTSVHECFAPPHINYGRPGFECHDRCTFIGVKGQPITMITSPAANELQETVPEGFLDYHIQKPPGLTPSFQPPPM